jgi:hypothetical protein
MSRYILALSAVVTLLVALFGLTGATFAARTSSSVRTSSASTPTLNFPAMQKHCAVLNVYLNGTAHPGVSCAHVKMPAKQAGVHPYTSTGPCDGNQTMEIDYNQGGTSICFHGTGYLAGFGQLFGVTDVIVDVSAGWYRWYDSSGVGHYCTLAYSALSPGIADTSITQVDPGNSNFGLCG